jgi:hypothetical protein
MAAPAKQTPLDYYKPLDKTSRQIRVVILSPGKEEDLIVCHHEIVTLEESGEYEALSYCWGSYTLDEYKKIMLNGVDFSVTPSLLTALIHLGYDDFLGAYGLTLSISIKRRIRRNFIRWRK